jgi:hypothetical protein
MKKGLKTKLDFRFGEAEELPDLNFEVGDPPTKISAKIIIVKKKSRIKKDKTNTELF